MTEDIDRDMSAAEFQMWMAYYNVEPFGQARDNWHIANLASLYASAHTPTGKKSLTTDDFMYKDPLTIERDRIKRIRSMFKGRMADQELN